MWSQVCYGVLSAVRTSDHKGGRGARMCRRRFARFRSQWRNFCRRFARNVTLSVKPSLRSFNHACIVMQTKVNFCIRMRFSTHKEKWTGQKQVGIRLEYVCAVFMLPWFKPWTPRSSVLLILCGGTVGFFLMSSK